MISLVCLSLLQHQRDFFVLLDTLTLSGMRALSKKNIKFVPTRLIGGKPRNHMISLVCLSLLQYQCEFLFFPTNVE
jgi:hypothetical protein